MRRVLAIMVCCVLSTQGAWAFGPHGDGKIRDDLAGPNVSVIPGGIPLVQNVKVQNFRVPVSYPSLSRRDLMPFDKAIDVEGRSSMRKFTVPLTLFGIPTPLGSLAVDVGDRGVQDAIADAKHRYGVSEVYDVRIDRKRFSILCVAVFCAYSRITTIVHAKGVVDDAVRSASP